MVSNAPDADVAAVAEHTVMLMLAVLKRLIGADRATRAGQWPFEARLAVGIPDLADAAVGLVGMGKVG